MRCVVSTHIFKGLIQLVSFFTYILSLWMAKGEVLLYEGGMAHEIALNDIRIYGCRFIGWKTTINTKCCKCVHVLAYWFIFTHFINYLLEVISAHLLEFFLTYFKPLKLIRKAPIIFQITCAILPWSKIKSSMFNLD